MSDSVERVRATLLAAGHADTISEFPEGTRTPVGRQGQYKSGGTRLAIHTKALVVPIALNSGECWPKNAFIKRPGTITVSIGPPISPEGQTPDSLLQQV